MVTAMRKLLHLLFIVFAWTVLIPLGLASWVVWRVALIPLLNVLCWIGPKPKPIAIPPGYHLSFRTGQLEKDDGTE